MLCFASGGGGVSSGYRCPVQQAVAVYRRPCIPGVPYTATVEMKKDSEKETSPESILDVSAFLPRHCIFFVKKTPLSRSRANPGVKWGKTVKKEVTERALIGSRFFSRTVLEFFWDFEEHDFHFSC